MTQTVSFSGSLPQIQAQVLDFLGLTAAQYAAALAAPAQTPQQPAVAILVPNMATAEPAHPGVPSQIALPAWAPAGSYWDHSEVPGGLLTLRGPQGEAIPWSPILGADGSVTAGRAVASEANANAEASAAGHALQQAISGG